MFKKYLAIAKLSWQEYFAYNLHFFFEVTGNIFLMLAIIVLWFAIYDGDADRNIGGYTLAMMVTYLLFASLINSFLWQTGQGDEINDCINRGFLSNYLVKPINVPVFWLFKDFARKFLTLIFGIFELALVFYFFKDYLVGPASLNHFVLFFIAIILSGFFHYFIFYIFSIIAFWIDETWGERFLIRVILDLAAGAIIPLSLFPPFWQTIFNVLPFKYLVFFPLQIYLGKISFYEMSWEFLIATVWLLVIIAISMLIWRAGVKKYSAYGA